jgi:hypothetical protein
MKRKKPPRLINLASAEDTQKARDLHPKLSGQLIENARPEDVSYVVRVLAREEDKSEAFAKMPDYLRRKMIRPVRGKYRLVLDREEATALARHGSIARDLIKSAREGDRDYVKRILSREADLAEAINKMPKYLRPRGFA